MKTVTIDRARWDVISNRIVKEDDPFRITGMLLSKSGLQCCLGFVGTACRIPKKVMLGFSIPDEIDTEAWPKSILDINGEETSVTIDLMRTNDNPKLTNHAREKLIIRQGQEAGIKFVFVRRYLRKPKGK